MSRKSIQSLVAVCLLGFSIIAAAQINALVPSPLSIALTVGQWLLKDSKKVYYIKVESTAPTEEQARQAGFKLAVTQAVGALVVSETEVKNKEVVRDEIIQYSSGYIDNFKVVSNTKVGGMTALVMDVWVVESKISDRILGESKTDGTVDGARAAAQLRSYLDQQIDSSMLFQQLTWNFPKHAFEIEILKSEVTMQGLDSTLEVRAKIIWNQDYIKALEEAVIATRESRGFFKYPPDTASVIKIKKRGDWLETIGTYRDPNKSTIFYANITSREPKLRMIIRDDEGSPWVDHCYHAFEDRIGGFYESHNLSGLVSINGDSLSRPLLKVKIGRNTNGLAKLKKIELQVVKPFDCHNGISNISY